MAPVEPEVANSNLRPLVELGSQGALIAFALVTLAHRFWRQAASLPPAQDVRVRLARRNRDIAIFSLTTLVCLAATTYFNVQRLVWSYKEWAHEAGENIPNALWQGWYANPGGPELYLGRWYQDTYVLHESFSIPLQKSTSWWWIQQSHALFLVWSVFIGAESRLRGMTAVHTLAFLALAHSTGLSVALNLFHVGLLLAPAPSTMNRTDLKNVLWTPSFMVSTLSVIIAFGMIFAFPRDLSDPSYALQFKGSMLIGTAVLAGVIPNSPQKLGVFHATVGEARRHWKPVFVVLAVLSTAMHWSYVQAALVDSKPKSLAPRTRLWTAYVQEQVSAKNRTLAATEDIYGSLFGHPATSGPAWDVLLSITSVCLWSAIRALDPMDMLQSTIWPWGSSSRKAEPTEGPDSVPPSPQTKRGRGKPKKAADASTTAAETTRRKGRRRAKDHDSDSEADAFAPSPSIADEVARLPHDGEHPVDAIQDAEASALAWLYFIVGGLGTAGAAVYGADVQAR